MKRKIEKYLAKKQGVDEAHIRFTEDGRYDFMGDLEGVLTAVRGKDGHSRKSDKKTKKSKKKAKTSQMHAVHMHPRMHHMPSHGMVPHHAGMYIHPHYMPAMHGPPMPPYGMHHHMPPTQVGKENSHPHSKYGKLSGTQNGDGVGRGPFSNSTTGHHSEGSNRLERQYHSPQSKQKDYRNGRTSPPPFFGYNGGDERAATESMPTQMFDSPKRKDAAQQQHGMTPISSLKAAFNGAPLSGEDMILFSPNSSHNLNKTLFGDTDETRNFMLDSALKTPRPKSPVQMRFRIGSARAGSGQKSMSSSQLQRVSISPIAQVLSSSRTKSFETDEKLGRSLAQVSLSNDLSHSLSVSFADDPRHHTKEEKTESRDDPQSGRLNMFVEPASPPFATTTDSGHKSPRNVTLDDSALDLKAPSPFDSQLVGDIRTPATHESKDRSFWSRQFGFSPADATFTPFKSPTPGHIKLEHGETPRQEGKSARGLFSVPSQASANIFCFLQTSLSLPCCQVPCLRPPVKVVFTMPLL